MWNPTRVLTAFVVGGIVGALLDQIHVRYGVLHYPHPVLFDQAWWVVPLFGAATLAILSGARMFITRFPATREHRVAGSLAWFVAAYWASGVWQAHPNALAVAYVIGLLLHTTHLPTLGFAVLLAACGCAFEAWLSSTGAFTYSFPDVAGLPIWLPGLYLQGAPAALAVTTWLHERPR